MASLGVLLSLQPLSPQVSRWQVSLKSRVARHVCVPLDAGRKPAGIEAVNGSPRNYGFLLDSTKYRNSPLPLDSTNVESDPSDFSYDSRLRTKL